MRPTSLTRGRKAAILGAGLPEGSIRRLPERIPDPEFLGGQGLSMDEPRENPHSCDLCGSNRADPVLEKHGAHYLSCRDCGFIYADLSAEEGARNNYEHFDGAIARYVAKAYSAKKQAVYGRLLRGFRPYRKLNRILEVGCNVGGFLYRARIEGWHALGIEPSAECAAFGRDRYGLDIIPKVLEEAELPEGSFDVAYSNAVFEHLPRPSPVFAALARALRPGGLAFIDTVNWDCYTRRFVGKDWKLLDPRSHLCLYTPATLRRHCEKAGLEVLRIATHGVRFRRNDAEKLRGLARFREELRKLPWSIASRRRLQGDSIAVWARKG